MYMYVSTKMTTCMYILVHVSTFGRIIHVNTRISCIHVHCLVDCTIGLGSSLFSAFQGHSQTFKNGGGGGGQRC